MGSLKRRSWVIGAVIPAVLILILASGVAGSERGFRPDWRPGASWEVAVTYARAGSEGESWSEPETWVYRVMAESVKGEALLRVEIRPEGTNVSVETDIYLDGETLAARKAVIRKGEGAVKLEIEFPGTAAPVMTGPTATPYDMPVFPLVPGETGEFTFLKKAAGGLYTRETLRQEVRRIAAAADDGGKVEKDLLEVTCTDGDGRVIFVQRWEPGRPWPLYGRNESMEYRLVSP